MRTSGTLGNGWVYDVFKAVDASAGGFGGPGVIGLWGPALRRFIRMPKEAGKCAEPARPDTPESARYYTQYAGNSAGHRKGMIDSNVAWAAGSDVASKGGFSTLDLGMITTVYGMETQPRWNGNQWGNQAVLTYKVTYSADGNIWKPVAGEFQNAENSASASNPKTQSLFPTAVAARYVRLYPLTYVNHPSIRFDVLLCPGGVQFEVPKDWPGHGCLDGHNDRDLRDQTTAEGCQTVCAADPQCKSIDWYSNGDDRRCLISYVTKEEVQGSFNGDTKCRYHGNIKRTGAVSDGHIDVSAVQEDGNIPDNMAWERFKVVCLEHCE